MTHDQIDRLVRQANPVADLNALEPVDTSALLVAQQRRMRMQTNDRIQVDQEPGKPKRGLFMGIAAVVAIVIGAVVIFQMTDETPVADDGPSPNSAAEVETATAFLQAFGSFDADTAASYLAVDVLDSEFGGLEGLRLETAFWEAQGFRLLIGACEAGDVSPAGTAVGCPYDYHGIRSDEMGLGPYEGSKWNFTILDGKIISASNDIRFIENGFSAQVWEPFAHWVSQNHPEDADIMYTDASHTMQRISEESNRLWEQHSKEYVKEVTGQTGLLGLPSEGATPSAPENGELVASMWEHISALGSFGNGWLYLYADGRLIWERLDPDPTGGWLERRLTPEGVELIRSEIIATGLFEPDQPPPELSDRGTVQVRNGDQLVYVNQVVPELHERLADLWSWLPADAWEDQEPRAFVPWRYAVCAHSGGFVNPADVSEHFADLPAAARDLLTSAPQLQMASLVDVDPAGFAFAAGSTEYCYDISTDQARTLAMIMDDAGVEAWPIDPEIGSFVTYSLTGGDEDFSGLGFDGDTLTLWPMLPHGVPALTGA